MAACGSGGTFVNWKKVIMTASGGAAYTALYFHRSSKHRRGAAQITPGWLGENATILSPEELSARPMIIHWSGDHELMITGERRHLPVRLIICL